MFTYSREGSQPAVSISELDENNFSRFNASESWDQRVETKKVHPDFHPREFLIGRLAVEGSNVLARLLQKQTLSEPESILGNRKALMDAMLQHAQDTGPRTPLFSGRGGNRPLRGEPMLIPDDGLLWGTSPELFHQSLGTSMNNPFHYINHRASHYDASAHNGEAFVPAIAVFDRSKLKEAKGNSVDKTSWKVKRGSPLGAVASMYYFDPTHFTLDR